MNRIMERLEYKYLVPEDALGPLRQQLLPFLVADSHVGQGGDYAIRSIYFDTAAFDYYYQKESGIQYRRKLRVRGYGQQSKDALAFLEIKRKDNAVISKSRVSFDFRDGEALFASGDIARYIHHADTDPRAVKDAQSFFYHLHRYSLLPTVLICYEREAYFGRYNSSLRLTLDKALRSAPFPRLDELYDEKQQRRSLEGHFILELKFNGGTPGWLKTLLEKYQLERQALSKYTISLDQHRIPQRATAFSAWSLAQLPGSRKQTAALAAS
jgi:hypothetical protein